MVNDSLLWGVVLKGIIVIFMLLFFVIVLFHEVRWAWKTPTSYYMKFTMCEQYKDFTRIDIDKLPIFCYSYFGLQE